MIKNCFVMRPFNEKHDNWHKNIYVPAIKSAGLTPVLGGGANATELVGDIESKIRKAHICLANISENNPNVFIEVGIALGLKKRMVFVCDKDCRPNMADIPSNLQRKYIVFFKDSEPEKARKEIGEHLLAVMATSPPYNSLLRMMGIGK